MYRKRETCDSTESRGRALRTLKTAQENKGKTLVETKAEKAEVKSEVKFQSSSIESN